MVMNEPDTIRIEANASRRNRRAAPMRPDLGAADAKIKSSVFFLPDFE